MVKMEIDITEQMEGFSKFAKQNDITHAMNEILLICRKTMTPPRLVLYQITEAANKYNHVADYEMACKIRESLDEQRHKARHKSEVIENAVEDIKIGLDEISHSGDPVWIKNFIEAIKLDLKEIESVL